MSATKKRRKRRVDRDVFIVTDREGKVHRFEYPPQEIRELPPRKGPKRKAG